MHQIRGMKVDDDEAKEQTNGENLSNFSSESQHPSTTTVSSQSDSDQSEASGTKLTGVQTGKNVNCSSLEADGLCQPSSKQPKLHIADQHAGKPVVRDIVAQDTTPHEVSSVNRQDSKSAVIRQDLLVDHGRLKSNGVTSSAVDKQTASIGELRTCARCYKLESTVHEFKKCKK